MAYIGFESQPQEIVEKDFSPLPAGEYQATVEKTEVKQTKDGTGAYISVQYKIEGPTHAGRVVFGNLNIKNKSDKAEQIGRQQLGQLQTAAGLPPIQDSDELIGAQLIIRLAVRKSEQYGDSNDVKGFKSLGNAPPVQMSQAAPAFAQSPPPQAAPAQVAPWNRNK